MAHDFAEREIRPIAMEREQMDARENFPWDMVKKGSQLGLRTLALPPEAGR